MIYKILIGGKKMRNNNSLFKKMLVFGIIVLFAGLIVIPSINSVNLPVKLKNKSIDFDSKVCV